MKDLTTGNERKLIFQFAIPMLLGNIFQQFYNITDSIVVGNYVGKEALAAVGASFPMIFALISLVMGIAMGFTVVISQFFGAKDNDSIKKAIDTMNIFLFFASIIITIAGIYFCNPIFRLLRLPREVLPQAESYFKIYITGSLVFFGFNGISAVLRGLGDSKTPFYFLIVSTVLNVILVLLFVVVFHLGIKGSAYATVIAQTLTFLAAIVYLNKYHKVINYSIRSFVFDKVIFLKTIKIGLPSGFQQTFVALGMMALFGIVNTFGTNAAAAYTVAGRIDSFAMMPAMNFSMALSAFVGQNIGANKFYRVKRGFTGTLLMTSIFSVLVTIITILWSKQLMSIFTNDLKVIELGSHYLIIVCSFYIIFTSMFITNGVMRGAGATLIPMFFTLLSLWIIRIPVAMFLSKRYGVEGIWWAIPIAWSIGLLCSYTYYKTGKWRTSAVVRHDRLIQP